MKSGFALMAALMLLAAATSLSFTGPAAAIAPYSDVRGKDLRGNDLDLASIRTLWFNDTTIWDPEDRLLALQVLEEGKNPGLGVRQLHSQGITGSGITVAIIDQNMCLDHPEFSGKIVKYRDFGTGQPADSGSMHGPAVTSLLVGTTIGTAPGARIYYAAVPSWLADAQYYADALDWIIAENRQLPAGQKIRAVSVSAAPSGSGSPFTLNNQAWDQACARARDEKILVLDCTQHLGLISAAFLNADDPENVARCTPGQPSHPGLTCLQDHICVPNSPRTQAEEYRAYEPSFQYMGQGGLSWSIPYATGVLAMGWQLKPDLTMEQIWNLLMASSLQVQGCNVIHPAVFINRVRASSSTVSVWLSHVTAADAWRTSLSAYNSSSTAAVFQVTRYSQSGGLIGTTGTYQVPPKAWTIVAAADLAYEGTGEVVSDRPLLLKLGYQYGQSLSVCEFFVTPATGRNWIIPNSMRPWFDYTGIALTNPGDSPITVLFEAWKNGAPISQSSMTVAPKARVALLSDQIWSGVISTNFDTAVIRASSEIPSPISISGNRAGDRHLFFSALPEPSTSLASYTAEEALPFRASSLPVPRAEVCLPLSSPSSRK